MEEIENMEWLQDIPSVDLVPLIEALFSLDCLKDPAVEEEIMRFEETEEENKVYEYSDEEVFTKYMEYRELHGDPVGLAEFLADSREWEYESEGAEVKVYSWDEFEKERTRHALELLEQYENKQNRKQK